MFNFGLEINNESTEENIQCLIYDILNYGARLLIACWRAGGHHMVMLLYETVGRKEAVLQSWMHSSDVHPDRYL